MIGESAFSRAWCLLECLEGCQQWWIKALASYAKEKLHPACSQWCPSLEWEPVLEHIFPNPSLLPCPLSLLLVNLATI